MYLYLQQPDIETCSTVRNTFEFVRHWTSPVISVSHASLFVGLVLAWTTSSPGKHVKLTTDFNLQTLTRMTISGLNTHTHCSLSLPGNAGNALWCLSLVLALQHIQVISKCIPVANVIGFILLEVANSWGHSISPCMACDKFPSQLNRNRLRCWPGVGQGEREALPRREGIAHDYGIMSWI